MIRAGDLAIVRKLILVGVEIGQRDEIGLTGLLISAYQGNFEMVRLLVEKGANLEDKDQCGCQPLVGRV
jgi:ankyrin repeat protein